MEQKDWIMFGIGVIITSLAFLCLLLILDTSISTTQSLSDRITSLEDKMIEHTKPVIQISRATIYNSEGQIILETNDDK